MQNIGNSKKQPNRTGDNLRHAGFDQTRFDHSEKVYRVRCSQCEAAVINGVACHETGCPNSPRDSKASF